ncbi:hypothetical protein [Burkholderia pseudomultivorans]|uniref:Uncharacterized protein n=1 Tax=Burkholderia pseudomultivorans TaxID=1207504 RepID=A0A6P2R1D5_9BURK|nr:hypothetical protein [Burkholderia pseudomultivorans]MDR8730267.1 hypothetical protein [Burkholderia pseudomultivorans]MDR8735488.1 hypothetical protein [Burkholderia pseudomultivorans]MDR8741577.1 hypothetical protein [Burkholderia pseudomultivorans]MDR8756547.1 hypothetical protein [Burkholderia pseudomultivorans]MDR8777991.1 hypothetical protein [Burkholderia pseudomultivorans]
MTQMMLDMHAAFAAPAARAPAAIAQRFAGVAIVVGGAAVLVAHALHAIAPAAGG